MKPSTRLLPFAIVAALASLHCAVDASQGYPQRIGVGGAGAGGPHPAGGANPGGSAAGVDPVGNANRAPGFVDLSPPMGAPLDGHGTPLTPPPPAGWTWYAIEGSVCRDGSQAGFFVHDGTADKLMIYLEGGGACSNDHFCAFNPANVNQSIAGDGTTVLGSALGAIAGRQQPGVYTSADHTGALSGIFDLGNAANPFKDWSQVYVPYCTGDVHAGTRKDGTVPNLAAPQQFVGANNMKLFIGRIVPTFKTRVSKVVITGASAGSFGAAMNFSMVQDAFGDVPVVPVGDSGVPFSDKYMAVCMQAKWRSTWNLDLPPDCTECQQADGGGLIHLADFLMRKHPHARVGLLSAVQDEIMRLFFSSGLQSCTKYDTADPVAIFVGQSDPTVYYPAQDYTDALTELRTTYLGTGRLGTFFMPGTLHQHIFRAEFFTTTAGGKTEAQWMSDFVEGTVGNVGP